MLHSDIYLNPWVPYQIRHYILRHWRDYPNRNPGIAISVWFSTLDTVRRRRLMRESCKNNATLETMFGCLLCTSWIDVYRNPMHGNLELTCPQFSCDETGCLRIVLTVIFRADMITRRRPSENAHAGYLP